MQAAKGQTDDTPRPGPGLLGRIAGYLPVFTAPDFKFGESVPPETVAGGTRPGWFRFRPEATSFMQDAYRFGWRHDFDWAGWMESEEANALMNDPDALASASVDQLRKLLSARLGRDLLVLGSLTADFDSGLLTRIVRRAKDLVGQGDPNR